MTTTTNLFAKADATEVPAGTRVFNAGDVADHVYVVQAGAVEIRRGDRVMDTIGPGGIFGEMAIIDQAPRSADAVAAVDSRVVAIPENRFEFMVSQTPRFARVVMSVLAERLRSANDGAMGTSS